MNNISPESIAVDGLSVTVKNNSEDSSVAKQ